MNLSLSFYCARVLVIITYNVSRYVVLYEALLRLLGGRDSVTEAEQFWAGTVQYSTLQVQNSTAQYSCNTLGGAAGVICWLSVLPADVVKSRMQADDLSVNGRR